jgi:hypothetical protein
MASCNLDTVLANKDFFRNITRSQFEIVITRFNEDLSWTDGIEHLCTVYNKENRFLKVTVRFGRFRIMDLVLRLYCVIWLNSIIIFQM